MLDTEALSQRLRSKTINVDGQTILITDFRNSGQEESDPERINCGGYGRVRNFRRYGALRWPSNPLPIDPALWKLRRTSSDSIKAQVFQSASCNWRCWYCYVPFHLLSGNQRYARYLTAAQLIDFYQAENSPSPIIDLSGGQPELTPEWTLWMMQELQKRDIADKIYLWSDDNLSNDYFWKYLSKDNIRTLSEYRNYGRVCCFKGFDEQSFAFNTGAAPDLFENQFKLFRRYIDTGLDVYAYVTLTSPDGLLLEKRIAHFIDRLQETSQSLPLRVVPLRVDVFPPVEKRITPLHKDAMSIQSEAVELWTNEIERRFSSADRSLKIYEIPL